MPRSRPLIRAVHPVLASKDVSLTRDFYVEMLGFKAEFADTPTAPTYAGVRRDEIELHLQWHDASHWVPGQDRPAYRFLVDDPDALLAEFQSRGIATDKQAISTPWGTREFGLYDPDGNGLHFYRDL